MKKTGSKSRAYLMKQSVGTTVTGGAAVVTTADKWYFVLAKLATASDLPVAVGGFFKSPSGATQINVATGEALLLLNDDSFCKTTADISGEMGVVDVTDDCDGDYISNIVDGYTALSGSLAGFYRFDDTTQDLTDATEGILNNFFDIVEDTSAGVYTITEKDDAQYLLRILLNKDVSGAGKKEVWLVLPVIISSFSTSLGLKDAMNLDLSWSKGEGRAYVYKRALTA
jgi:hypothetical protein